MSDRETLALEQQIRRELEEGLSALREVVRAEPEYHPGCSTTRVAALVIQRLRSKSEART